MITITKQDNNFIFEVRGMHKLWAFKNQITIPAENITKVHQNLDSIKGWKGWRSPGTSVASLLTAGTFIKEDKKIFWDVSNMENCIIVELKDEEYNQLIIEVENPKEAIELLSMR